MMKMMTAQAYEYITSAMPTWDGFEKLVEPIKNFKDVLLEKNLKTYTPNSGPGAWNVLNHGDFLMKNLMYKMRKEGEGVEDFMMVSS
jgi:hypothetical protein